VANWVIINVKQVDMNYNTDIYSDLPDQNKYQQLFKALGFFGVGSPFKANQHKRHWENDRTDFSGDGSDGKPIDNGMSPPTVPMITVPEHQYLFLTHRIID